MNYREIKWNMQLKKQTEICKVLNNILFIVLKSRGKNSAEISFLCQIWSRIRTYSTIWRISNAIGSVYILLYFMGESRVLLYAVTSKDLSHYLPPFLPSHRDHFETNWVDCLKCPIAYNDIFVKHSKIYPNFPPAKTRNMNRVWTTFWKKVVNTNKLKT